MQRCLLVLAVCLTALTLAVGQSSQPSPSPAQPQAQPSQAQPSQAQQPSAQPTPKSGDTTVSGNSNSTSSQRPANPDQGMPGAQQQPSRAANNGGGLPWGWIVIGIVAVVILIALATRDTTARDRVEREEKIDRDDIRRAG